jgi:hypothetical protein
MSWRSRVTNRDLQFVTYRKTEPDRDAHSLRYRDHRNDTERGEFQCRRDLQAR